MVSLYSGVSVQPSFFATNQVEPQGASLITPAPINIFPSGLISILSTGLPKPRSMNASITGFPVFSRAQKGFGASNSTPMASSSFLSCSRTPAGVFFESSAGAITAFAFVFCATSGRAARRSGWMPIASIRSHSGSFWRHVLPGLFYKCGQVSGKFMNSYNQVCV